MKTQKQTINEMIAQIIAEARKLGYSEATIWRNITPKFQTVAVYYEKRGVCFYDPAITRELVDLQKERKIGGKPPGRVLSDGNLAFKYAKAWDKVSDLGG